MPGHEPGLAMLIALPFRVGGWIYQAALAARR
jgi:hypothetical protein